MEFLGLKPQEFAAIVTGVCGLVFSLQAHKRAKSSEAQSGRAEARAEKAESRAERAEERSLRSEREGLELAVANEKHNVLTDLRIIRTASDRRCWKIRLLRGEAEAFHIASSVQAADELLALEQAYIAPVDEIEGIVRPIEPKQASHADLVTLREKVSTMVKERIAAEKLDEEMNETNIVELRKNIELQKSRLAP